MSITILKSFHLRTDVELKHHQLWNDLFCLKDILLSLLFPRIHCPRLLQKIGERICMKICSATICSTGLKLLKIWPVKFIREKIISEHPEWKTAIIKVIVSVYRNVLFLYELQLVNILAGTTCKENRYCFILASQIFLTALYPLLSWRKLLTSALD